MFFLCSQQFIFEKKMYGAQQIRNTIHNEKNVANASRIARERRERMETLRMKKRRDSDRKNPSFFLGPGIFPIF